MNSNYYEPLHGEGQEFESPRANCFSAFFNEIESETASATTKIVYSPLTIDRETMLEVISRSL